jgi:hypothetical protein
MRMLELGGELDLALEADRTDGARPLRGEDLDDHRPAERAVGRQEQAAHPAAAQLALELVRSANDPLKLLAQISRHREPPAS